MPIMQTIKDNPWKILLCSSGTIVTLVGGLFTLDARYAHADDVNKDKQQIQQVIKETTITLRQQMIEDKLFELDVKKAESPARKLSPVDTALAERYKRQLEEIARSKINN